MTYEVLLGLGWAVLIETSAAVALKGFLLWRAWLNREDAKGAPPTAPERIVADSEVLDGFGRVLFALLLVGLGLVWVMSVSNIPRPEPGALLRVSSVTLALAALIFTMSTVLVLQGVRGLVYYRKLRDSIWRRRDACASTTFEGCPYITPERLLEVRAKAIALVESTEEIINHGGSNS
jgi:hypothetical protein